MSLRVYAMGDLHIFAPHARWKEAVATLQRTAQEADVFVLLGDVFEIRRSGDAPGYATVAQSAARMLRDWCARFAHCHFHLLFGNHDCMTPYTAAAAGVADTVPNLDVHPHVLRLGSAVFLHGDVPLYAPSPDGLTRYRAGLQGFSENWLSRRLYHASGRLLRSHHLLSACAFPPPILMRQLHRYLTAVGHTAESGVRDVYFGHTHAPLDEVHFRGMHWHNGGAPFGTDPHRVLRVRGAGEGLRVS